MVLGALPSSKVESLLDSNESVGALITKIQSQLNDAHHDNDDDDDRNNHHLLQQILEVQKQSNQILTELLTLHVPQEPRGTLKHMFQNMSKALKELKEMEVQEQQQDEQKQQVRDHLTCLLPWETRCPERKILVEECKQTILQLSTKSETFTGPFALPNSYEDTGVEGTPYTNTVGTTLPSSPESLKLLSKLQPFPKLLSDFDLDIHVGLIQRMLKVDPTLALYMARASPGGGTREVLFWKNYFFHCAVSRYEAGLSVDEIWSEEAIHRYFLETQQEQKLEAEKAKKENAKWSQWLQAATKSVIARFYLDNLRLEADSTEPVSSTSSTPQVI